ncbi:mechanosensitive ion channel family protein [Halobacteria archaeon HArc-gm2]|nr:mechanosensitive ion channel family protein [Halobacteria archaeon HArc-gm2]
MTLLQTVTDGFSLDPAVVVQALLVLVGAYVAGRTVSGALTRIADRFLAQRFRVTLLIPIVKFVIYGGALYVTATLLFKLTTAQLVAFSGVLGVAVGLGLKDLFADIVGGLVLVTEQPYQIGDMVTIGNHYGEVVDIGIRSTKLYTLDDTMVTVPNYLFFNEAIANANDGNAEMLVTVTFQVDPGSDANRARDIVEEALLSSQYVYVSDAAPVEVFVSDELHYRMVEGRAYVNDLRNQLRFESDVSERVLAAFAAADIESPQVPASVADGAEG